MPRRLGWILLLLSALCPRLLAEEPSAEAAWAATLAEAVQRLEALAGEAHGRKLYGCRDELFERLLLLAPDHEAARKRLKYKRRDGAWVRSAYSRPKDRGNPAARTRHAEALAAWRMWWQAQVTAIHESAVVAQNAKLQAEILRTALVLAPDAPEVHKLAGEVRHGAGPEARWILADTRRGLETRARFLKAAREATRAVPAPKPGQLEDTDRAKRFSWPIVLQGRTTRVIGDVSAEELNRHHEIAEAAAAVFHAVFGIQASLPSEEGRYGRGYCLYVTPGLERGNAFLRTEPGITPRDMQFLTRLVFAYLGKRQGAVVKANDAVHRMEGTSHAIQSLFCSPHLLQYEDRPGAWAKEAVGLYLAWLQVRTRLLYTVKDATGGRYGTPRPGVPPWERRMGDQSVDWHTLAAEVIAAMPTSDLHLTAGKDINNLDSHDLLAGYGLAVFVIEAHPDRSVEFFRDVGSQERIDLDVVLEKHFHQDLETLRPHLLRWLTEMGELAPPAGEVR